MTSTHIGTLILGLSFLLVSLTLPAHPAFLSGDAEVFPPPRWEKLGSRKVNFSLDRDEILVTAREGGFTALKLKVRRSGINLHKVVIHFGDGSTQQVRVQKRFHQGEETRVLDLDGGKRIIHKVVFIYDTKNIRSRKARVELWGRH